MNKRRDVRIPLLILAFCLCAGSLAFLPVAGQTAGPVPEVLEIDFDQTEFEEDLLLLILAATPIAGLIFIKLGSMHPGFRPAPFSLVSPPPKNS